jgi:hypothetical protein
MSLASILCAAAGHTWTPTTDVSDSNATFRCERCGHAQAFGAGTHRIDKTSLKGDFQKSAGPFGGPRGVAGGDPREGRRRD